MKEAMRKCRLGASRRVCRVLFEWVLVFLGKY